MAAFIEGEVSGLAVADAQSAELPLTAISLMVIFKTAVVVGVPGGSSAVPHCRAFIGTLRVAVALVAEAHLKSRLVAGKGGVVAAEGVGV